MKTSKVYWITVDGCVYVFRNHFNTAEEVYGCVETIGRATGMRIVLMDHPPRMTNTLLQSAEDGVDVLRMPDILADRQRYFQWEFDY